MATYNGEKHLPEQLDSILSQSLIPSEIIIVDDCSTDDTWQILQNYAERYSTIKIYQNKQNVGACQSFNKAMSLTTGKYIALSDQDDVWLPNKLEVLTANIGDSLLIHSDAYIVDENLKIIANTFVKGVMNQKCFIDYLFANNVNGNTCLFKQELLKLTLPIPNNFYGHDHYLAIIASYLGKIKYLESPLINYRQHGNNLYGINQHVSFDKFLIARKKVETSLRSLPLTNTFKPKDNFYIELIADYHLSIYKGKWQSKYSLFNILSLPQGLRYFSAYLILTGFGSRKIARILYNWLKK